MRPKILSFLCVSFCQILRYSAKFRPKTHTRSLKNAKFFSRASSTRARGLSFYLFRQGARPKTSPFYVRHFAAFCNAGLNLGQKHILAASETPNFSRARLRRALEEGLFSFWAGEAVKNKPSCVRHFATFWKKT